MESFLALFWGDFEEKHGGIENMEDSKKKTLCSLCLRGKKLSSEI
jgi:hypothetical protein